MSVVKEQETSRNNPNTHQSRSVVEITVSVHLQASAKFPQTLEESTRVAKHNKL